MTWLKGLWGWFRRWLQSPAGQVVEQAAVAALKTLGQMLLDYLLFMAKAKAMELEGKYGSGTGVKKAAVLDGFLNELLEEAGQKKVPSRVVNWIRETAVAAIQK